MLHRHRGGAFEVWSCGRGTLLAGGRRGPWRLPAGVRCRLGHRIEGVGLLDTGAEWSVLDGGMAESLRSQLEYLEVDIDLSTRHGLVHGRLHRLTVELLPDPAGG